MPFHSARCEVCREYYFRELDVIAYRLTSNPRDIRRIDLRGQEPWSGIRVICLSCVRLIGTWNS